MGKFKVAVLLFCLSFLSTYSQTSVKVDSLISFYPAHIGDKWFYHVLITSTIESGSQNLYCSREMVKDTMIGGLVYKKILSVWDVHGSATKSVTYEHVDILSGQVFLLDYNLGNDAELITDFSMKEGESFSSGSKTLQFIGSSEKPFLGNNIKAKTFHYQRYLLSRSFVYYENLGLCGYHWYADFVDATYTLIWCKINNVYYGDTLSTDISSSKLLSKNYKLYQNYPNPFNPSTTISYDIPSAGFVSLKIYDFLGREIKTLVNGYQQAGSYHKTFSTSELNFSSGVYFYQLRAGDPSRGSGQGLVQTKKMVLIK